MHKFYENPHSRSSIDGKWRNKLFPFKHMVYLFIIYQFVNTSKKCPTHFLRFSLFIFSSLHKANRCQANAEDRQTNIAFECFVVIKTVSVRKILCVKADIFENKINLSLKKIVFARRRLHRCVTSYTVALLPNWQRQLTEVTTVLSLAAVNSMPQLEIAIYSYNIQMFLDSH